MLGIPIYIEKEGRKLAKMKKREIDLDTLLVNISILLKGFRQELNIWTTATETTEFVDWLNNSPALNSYKIKYKEKFTNKYFMFNDYKKKKTICINKDQIKMFSIPFFQDVGEDVEFKFLQFQ